MLNAASLVELKFSPQKDSGCLDCIWKDIPSEYVLLLHKRLAQCVCRFVYLWRMFFCRQRELEYEPFRPRRAIIAKGSTVCTALVQLVVQ